MNWICIELEKLEHWLRLSRNLDENQRRFQTRILPVQKTLVSLTAVSTMEIVATYVHLEMQKKYSKKTRRKICIFFSIYFNIFFSPQEMSGKSVRNWIYVQLENRQKLDTEKNTEFKWENQVGLAVQWQNSVCHWGNYLYLFERYICRSVFVN